MGHFSGYVYSVHTHTHTVHNMLFIIQVVIKQHKRDPRRGLVIFTSFSNTGKPYAL